MIGTAATYWTIVVLAALLPTSQSADCGGGVLCDDTGGTCSGGACDCNAGYEGAECATNTDDCAATPCLNGGTCTDGVNTFTCACMAGYEGNTCDVNTDECSSNPCLNGGTCVDHVNAYTCSCASTFTGTHCENVVCGTSGECTVGSGECQGGECYCNPTHSGTTCQSACTPACTGDTVCTDASVPTCAAIACTSACLNGGVCRIVNTTPYCKCALGYSGTDCSTDINECVSSPCQNGATCVDQVNGYNCTCATDYVGMNCVTKIVCRVDGDCGMGGTCDQTWLGGYCICPANKGGSVCDLSCSSGCTADQLCVAATGGLTATCAACTCSNNGTCMEYPTGSAMCNCTAGWSGETCSTANCTVNPCMNSGVCSASTDLKSLSCNCTTGYIGDWCETSGVGSLMTSLPSVWLWTIILMVLLYTK